MWPRFGIKIGNSTLCLASAKETKKLEVIVNKHGDRVSQAFLHVDGEEVEIGLPARQKLLSRPGATVCNNFQLFPDDLTKEQVDNAVQHIPCGFNSENFEYELELDKGNSPKGLSPYEVCVNFFKAIFELAKQCHTSEERPIAVLSIPEHYHPECWDKLAKAAETAGFYVAQIITEPTAALLAYKLEESTEDIKKVLSIKTGGLLTSFTLFEIDSGLYSILKTEGPFYIGGNQFTGVLADFIAEDFQKKYKLNPKTNPRSIAKIRAAADNCKQILTTLNSTQIYVDSLMDGIDFNLQMSRVRFENLIQPVLNDFVDILTSSLERMNIDRSEIDEIVLSGGTMKIPRLQTVVANYFPEAKLISGLPPDEVAAIGCAGQSLYINPDKSELTASKKCACTTSDIHIWHESSPRHQLLFKKGTLLPSQTTVEVERSLEIIENGKSVNPAGKEVFFIETEDQVEEITLDGEIREVQGMFQLSAKIEDQAGWPLIKLSCS